MPSQITRRQFGLGMAAVMGGAKPPKPPNIVLFLADDLGWRDISCYHSTDIRTPNIDSLARGGVRFSRYYCNAPECTPTRTALLTGRYQQRVGGMECAIGAGNAGRYDDAIWLQQRGELGLPANEWTFPKALRQNGYRTACFGKWHLGYADKFRPNVHGFDEYLSILGGNANYFTHREENGALVLNQNGKPLEHKGYLTDIFAEHAIAWLKRRHNKPFFLYLPFTAPHTPIQDPDAYGEGTGAVPVHNRNRAVYAKMVERMDARIGDVLNQIRAMGSDDNTIAVFMSDNGAEANGNNGELRGRKSSLWEGGCVRRVSSGGRIAFPWAARSLNWRSRWTSRRRCCERLEFGVPPISTARSSSLSPMTFPKGRNVSSMSVDMRGSLPCSTIPRRRAARKHWAACSGGPTSDSTPERR